MSYEQTNRLCVYCSERISIPSWDQLQWIQAQAEHVKVCAPKIRAELTSAQEKLKVAVEALENFQLGHEHKPELEHTRAMGDTYGWCDHCNQTVAWDEDIARDALAKIRGGV